MEVGDIEALLWKCIILALLRVIWLERNDLIFKGKKRRTLMGLGLSFGFSLSFGA